MKRSLFHRRRVQKAEDKWYEVVRCIGDTPPFGAPEEEKIRGWSEAQRRKAELDAALTDAEKKFVTNLIRETSAPSRPRPVGAPQKRDDRKRK